MTVTIDDVRHDHEVQVFIDKANEKLGVLGYTEHGPRHAGRARCSRAPRASRLPCR